MKLFLCSLIILNLQILMAQSEEIEHVKIGEDTTQQQSFFPHIDKYYDGEIPISVLGDLEGIKVSKNYSVKSFVISYPHGENNIAVPIAGNVIPQSVIEDIYKFALGEMIFITNIVSENEEKMMLDIVPMNLTPIE